MHKLMTTQELRRELKDKNSLLPLLDRLRKKDTTLTEHERSLIHVGISDFAYTLAKKHYGEPQSGVKGQWYNGEYDDAHLTRMEVITQFIIESSPDIGINGVIFSIHRRFPWIELVVEMKVLGISYLEDMPLTKRINSSVTKDIILGNKLRRQEHEKLKRLPGHDEVIVAFTRELINQGKTVSWNRIKRFSERVSAYMEAKNKTSCLSFDETYYNPEE